MGTKTKEVTVCDHCEHPTVGTMVFPGAEVYCPTCGTTGDLFFGKRVLATKDLIAEEKEINAWWDKIVADILPARSQRVGCKKCKALGARGGYHADHATEEEKEKSKKARVAMKDRVAKYEAEEGSE